MTEDSSKFWSTAPEADEGMNIGGAGPPRLRPLVHPREYWNVWAKMTPVKQQRISSKAGSLGDRQPEAVAVLWKCIAPSVLLDLEKKTIHISTAALIWL
jgi:hypothetical protein